jgi:pimeloyl-ACP methyl ester carboxylesterase
MKSRTPLLLLPGLLCDGRLWRDQAKGLDDIAEAAIADNTRDDSIAGMAARALAQMPDRFALAGLSMGGYVAFEMARQAPERIVRLALLDTTASPDSPERARQRRLAMQSVAVGRFAGVTRQLLPQLVHPAHVEGPVGAAVQAMAARVGAEAYVRQQKAILARPDFRPWLGEIKIPTLVIVGDHDVMTPPAEARIIQQGIAGARLEIVPDCGHLPPMEKPEQVTAMLRDWLR